VKIFPTLAFFLVAVSLSSYADWKSVGTSKTTDLGQRTFYVDFSKIAKSGYLRKVSELVDFGAEVNGSRSIQTVSEFDCKNKTVRILSFMAYSGNMAHGKLVYSDLNPRQVEQISDDKVDFATLICTR
jgi:hypothetical protein